jgi:uncharacterized protein YbjT (DUF2867 family)
MIVVTGATGTVGTPLVESLLKRGAAVRAVARHAALDSAVESVVADLGDVDSLVPALDGADAVFVLTPVTQEMGRNERNVVEAARRTGKPRVVLLAAAGVDQDVRGVRFLEAHAEGLAALDGSGLEHTVLAPNGFFQNLLGMAGAIRAGTLAVPAGNAAVSFIDARDVAEVAAHVLTTTGHEGAVYTLTGPEALTHEEIAARLGARYLAVSPDQAREAMAGLDPWRVEGLIELYGIYAAGYAAEVSGDVAHLLGRPPRSLAEFAADHRDAFA